MCKKYVKIIFTVLYLSVAQMDNASDSDSEDRGFESLRAEKLIPPLPYRINCTAGAVFTLVFLLYCTFYNVFTGKLAKIFLEAFAYRRVHYCKSYAFEYQSEYISP